MARTGLSVVAVVVVLAAVVTAAAAKSVASDESSSEEQEVGRTCPQHKLGSVNSILTVTAGREADRVELFPDVLLADAAHSGCSVLDVLKYPALKEVNLKFYYGSGLDDFESAQIGHAADLYKSAHIDKERCIAVYAFGYKSTPDNNYTRMAIEALVASKQYNTFLVDWSAVNNFPYQISVQLIDHVAKGVARDLKGMMEQGACIDFVVGHSLGGQMTGAIGRHLQRIGASLPCAIGLDPAAPLYEGRVWGCARRLAPEDAERVVALHTDICGLGSSLTRAHAAFFPNGGHHGQPGCPGDAYDFLGTATGVCSHVRAVEVFARSVADAGAFPARRCASWEAFRAGRCDDAPQAPFAPAACDARAESGSFFMQTNGEQPLHTVERQDS